MRTLKSNGVDVRFLSSNQTVIGESEFVLTVFAALAQEESSNLSKRVIFGKKQNAKKGRVPNCVYGYDKIDTFTLEINHEESAVVRLIYKWYIAGEGTRRITITRQMLPEANWYVHERPELRIISDEDFALVQKKLSERQERYKNDNPAGRYSGRHIFSNLIKCGECGKGFSARVYKWKNTYVRYRCAAHNNGGNAVCANNVTIDENELLDGVKQYLLSIIDDRKTFAAKLIEQYERSDDDVDIVHLNKAKGKLEKRRIKFKEMYAEGLIGMEELKTEYAAISEGLRSIDAELEGLRRTRERVEDIDDIADSIERLLMQNEFTNVDMRSIIEKIVVYPDKSV